MGPFDLPHELLRRQLILAVVGDDGAHGLVDEALQIGPGPITLNFANVVLFGTIVPRKSKEPTPAILLRVRENVFPANFFYRTDRISLHGRRFTLPAIRRVLLIVLLIILQHLTRSVASLSSLLGPWLLLLMLSQCLHEHFAVSSCLLGIATHLALSGSG